MKILSSEGYELRELLETELPKLLAHGKLALNELALCEFNEAPFIQWGLVSLKHFVELERRAFGEGEEYMQMALKAVSYAGELSMGGLSRFGESSGRRGLINAVAHIECAVNDCLAYRKSRDAAHLFEASAQIKLAIVESIIARERLRERAA